MAVASQWLELEAVMPFLLAALLLVMTFLWWSRRPAKEEEYDNYFPSLYSRTLEAVSVLRSIFFPVELQLGKDDCVVVMDAIDAYRDMYDDKTIQEIIRLCRLARARGATVVFTRWVRFRPEKSTPLEELDATDVKGHWTNYIPPSQTEVFEELQDEAAKGNVVFVKYVNAFTAEAFRDIVAKKKLRRLILCGGWYEACIKSTCHCALEHNMHCGVVRTASVGHGFLGFYACISMQMVHATMYKLPQLLPSARAMTWASSLRSAFNVSWGWPAAMSAIPAIQDPVDMSGQ